MPSPFPGFDPYLENEWDDIHGRLISYISEQLNTTLPDDLVCRAEKQVTMRAGEEERPGRWVKPDDFVVVGGVPGGTATAGAATLAATETFEVEPEVYVAKWLEIRDRRDREVVTTIEVLSPINKTGGDRETFREKQRDLAAGGVSLVEIDLLRRGLWALYPPEDGVPEEFREPYRLVSTAVASAGPDRRSPG